MPRETGNLSTEAREDLDLYGLANRAVRIVDQPMVSIDCGIDDPHLSLVRGLHVHLEAIGYPHEYREPPGSHIGGYCDAQVQRGLAQHMTVFQSNPSRCAIASCLQMREWPARDVRPRELRGTLLWRGAMRKWPSAT